jgi:hypothetical protein
MTLKRQFGSRLSRLLGGGATLSSAEYALLDAAITALPPDLRAIVEAQFDAYNLVQREVDGRALRRLQEREKAVTVERVVDAWRSNLAPVADI